MGCSIQTFSQSYMVLEKMGTKKRYEIYKGSKLDVRIKDDSFYSRIMILGFTDSAIRLQERLLPMKDITAVDVSSIKKPSFIRKLGPTLMIAGAGLLLIDLFNQTVVQNGSYETSSKVFTSSALMAGTGLLLTFVKKDKKKLKGWWRLRMVYPN